ncbi:MAG: TIGR04283 family arsenosugar biosynthesis glycosyltransferase [Caldimonas sp.]
MPGTRLSIVMPVLDEAPIVESALRQLAGLRAAGVEVIVVDGGSRDATAAVALPLADRVVATARGRARQMNAGAAVARGDVFLFLHADTVLPNDAVAAIEAALGGDGTGHRPRALWGRFDVRITGGGPMLAIVAMMMNARSRLTGIATGDQAIFVERGAFAAAGGFPDQPLMEDIELSNRLRLIGRPACLRERVATSGRRWQSRGVWPTILLMWRLRLLYRLGVAPERLARSYR